MHLILCLHSMHLFYAFHYMHSFLCISFFAFHSMHFSLCISLYSFHFMLFILCISLYAFYYFHFFICMSCNVFYSKNFILWNFILYIAFIFCIKSLHSIKWLLFTIDILFIYFILTFLLEVFSVSYALGTLQLYLLDIMVHTVC